MLAPPMLAADASSKGYGAALDLSATVSLLGSANAGLVQTPVSMGSGSSDYGPNEQTVLGVQVGLLGTTVLQTGTLTTSAQHQSAIPVANASGGVENANVNLRITPLLPLIGLTADVIRADAEITGVCGALQATGTSRIVNGQVTAAGGQVIAIAEFPSANVQVDVLSLLGIAGVQLTLNEQVITGDAFQRSISVNAVHLSVDANAPLASLIGDIVIGHAEASRSCAPGDGPNLRTIKSANPNPVIVNTPLEFLIEVSNVGNQPATTVSVADSLDPSFALQSAVASDGGNCAIVGQDVSCMWSSIPAGASRTATLTVLPSQAGMFSNTAIASFDGPDVDPGNDGGTVDITVLPPIVNPSANFSVSKVATPDPATVGLPLTYTITVSNAGPDAAGASVTDSLPSGLSAQSVIASAGGLCTGTSTISCDWSSIAAGSAATVVVVVLPTNTTTLVNTATVAVAGPATDPDPDDNIVTIMTEVMPATPIANVSLTKSASANPVTIGETLTYTLVASNAGPDTAAVRIVDALPGGLSATALVASAGGSCAGTVEITCGWAAVEAGQSVNAQISVVPQTAGALTNSASVSPVAPAIDPDPSDNTATVITTILAAAGNSADLGLTMQATPNPVTVGQNLAYTLTITNVGPDGAPVNLANDLPQGLTAQSLVVLGGGSCTGSNMLRCSWPTVAAGASVSISFSVQPQTPGALINSASVAVGDGFVDPNLSNNSASSTVNVVPASAPLSDLSVTEVATPQPGRVGESLRFTLRVTNSGPDAAAVQLLNVLDNAFLLVSAQATAGGSCSGDPQISCSWPSVANGQTVTVALDVLPATAGTFGNTVSVLVAGGGVDPDPSNNQASIPVLVDPALMPPVVADLGIATTLSTNPTAFGDTLTMFLAVTNAGPDAAPARAVSALDGGFQLLSVNPDSGGACTGSSGVDCTWPSVAVGQTVIVAVEVVASTCCAIPNQALVQVGVGATDPQPANNVSNIIIEVLPPNDPGESDLVVTKQVVPATPVVGGPLSFLITVTNAGPDFANGPVQISDTIAAGITVYSAAADSNGTCAISGSTVTCSWNGIAVGHTASASILAVAELPGFYTNAVVTTQVNTDPNPIDNNPEIEFEVIADALSAAGATCRVTEQLTANDSDNLPWGNIRYGGADLSFDAAGMAGQSPLTHRLAQTQLGDELLFDNLPADAAVTLLASSRDGSRSIVQSSVSLIDGTPLATPGLFQVDHASGAATPLPDLLAGAGGNTLALAADGSALAYVGGSGQSAASTSTEFGIYDLNTGQTSVLEQWPVAAASVSALSANDNLQQLALLAQFDVLGSNADQNSEVYRYQRSASTLTQITDTVTGSQQLGGFDGAGNRLAYTSDGLLHVHDRFAGLLPDTGSAQSPILGQNGQSVYYLDSAGQLAERTLEGGATVQLTAFTDANLGSDALLAHEGAGQSFLLRSSRELLAGGNPDGKPQLFVVDCDSFRAGAWYNDQRSGHGWDIQRVRDEIVSLWFHYTESGRATWKIANGKRYGRAWKADLMDVHYNYDDGSRDISVVGTLAILFIDSHNAIAHWTVDEVTRFERIAFIEFDRRPPAVDFTAVWYDPADPGWGLSLSHQGDTVYGLVYVYDSQGQALWIDGVAHGGQSDVTANLFNGVGLCPTTCPETAPLPSFSYAGRFSLEMGDYGEVSVGTQLVHGSQLQWLKADRPIAPLGNLVQ